MELSCPLGIRTLPRKYTDHALVLFSHIINPLLTKLARSRWLDIGLVLGQYPAILTEQAWSITIGDLVSNERNCVLHRWEIDYQPQGR